MGLMVCRGTSIMLVCPTDGLEEIANPFLQASPLPVPAPSAGCAVAASVRRSCWLARSFTTAPPVATRHQLARLFAWSPSDHTVVARISHEQCTVALQSHTARATELVETVALPSAARHQLAILNAC